MIIIDASRYCCRLCLVVFFFKQKTAYDMRISDWSSDVCSSDLYSPGVVVTTIINGPPVITEHVETSTRTYYETVPVRKRHVAKKKWKPKPKPKVRCVC